MTIDELIDLLDESSDSARTEQDQLSLIDRSLQDILRWQYLDGLRVAFTTARDMAVDVKNHDSNHDTSKYAAGGRFVV